MKQMNLRDTAVKRILFTVLAIFLTRCWVALLTPGYSYDQSAFTLWGMRMAQVPASEFYAPDYFADYPPGYLWVLKLIGMAMLAWKIPLESALAGLLLALPVAIGEAVLGGYFVKMAQEKAGESAAKFWSIFMIFNPSLWFNTGVWKQVDALFALLLTVCFVQLSNKNYRVAALFYGLALSVKPQALILGPVLAAAFLVPFIDGKNRAKQLLVTLQGAVIAILPVWLTAIPFWGVWQAFPKLIEKYLDTSTGYPYATINAAGLMAALGANWQQWDTTFLLLSWKTWGTLAIVAMTVWMLFLAWKSQKKGTFCPILLAGFYASGIFAFGHAMHERYVVFGAVLVLAAAVKWQDKQLFLAGAGFTVTSFFNQLLVYMVLDTPHQFLNEGWSKVLLQLLGVATVVIFVLLAKRTCQLLLGAKQPEWNWKIKQSGEKIPQTKQATSGWAVAPEKSLPYTLREILLLCAATAVLAGLSFAYLGDTTAPQTLLDAQGQTITFSTQTQQYVQQIWIYPGISYGGRVTITDADTNTVVVNQELNYATCFQWKAYVLPQAGHTYTIQLENAQLIELAFKANGNTVKASSDRPMVVDELHLVPETISQLNSMYFDEIYHARTGFEFLNKLPVYETTHPPLGKDFIALGIAMFGMTGFGWRFFGTLFGVFILPALYLFVRQLSRRKGIAAFAAVLIFFDFMRYSQSRIATIDTYVVFFILLCAWFMTWYCQSVLEKGVQKSILPMALCGISFGLAIASKWTGFYAGAGLAVVYFAVLFLRYKQKQSDFSSEFWAAIGGGCLFFVVIPFAIYMASYLPYFIRESDFGLQKWWICQTTMYNYHSTLQSTHPYQSAWYTWLVDYRPVWYYYNHQGESYASISGMINPIISWLSSAALVYTIVQVVRRKATRAQVLTLVFFAAQLLPWVLVTRCTFLYHYFPSLVFAVTLLALAVQQLTHDRPHLRKVSCITITAAAAVLFVWFFPALSGLPIGAQWAQSMKWFDSWVLYIL